MSRRSSMGDEAGGALGHVIPRYLLSVEERMQLSPGLSKRIHEAHTIPYNRPEVHINHNYPTVSSRYHQPPPHAGGVVRGPVTPSRPSDTHGSDHRSPRDDSASRRRSISPSLAKYPAIKSRYLDDPRLTLMSPSRRSTTPSQQAPILRSPPSLVTATHGGGGGGGVRTPSPFRAGLRPATPDDISRRNRALIASAHTSTKACSVVKAYIQSAAPTRSPSRRSQTPDRPGTRSTPVRTPEHRVSPSSRARSPPPRKQSLVEEARFIERWREERSGTKVPPGHVPRVAKLSLGYQSVPPPLMHWVPQPTPMQRAADTKNAAVSLLTYDLTDGTVTETGSDRLTRSASREAEK